MSEKLLKIINHYGIKNQVKKFNEEAFELIEAIIQFEDDFYYLLEPEGIEISKEHIAEEIADCYVLLEQIRLKYDIYLKEVAKIGRYKIDRQLKRMEKEKNGK